MKNISVLGLSLCMYCSFSPLSPAYGAPYELDALLPAKSMSAEILELKMHPLAQAHMPKFQAAIQKDPSLLEVIARAKPGEPLPYDKRFGLTEKEYREMVEALTTNKFESVGFTKLTITKNDKGEITVKSPMNQYLREGLVFKDGTVSVPAIGTLRDPSYFSTKANDPLYNEGFSWRHERLAPNGEQARVVVSKLLGEEGCFLALTVKKLSNGALVEQKRVQLKFECQ